MIRSRPSVIAIVLLALAASACSSVPGFSASPSPVLDGIRDRGEIRVGMTGDYPPLNVKNKHDDLIGFEPALARMLAQGLGVELALETRPFGQLLEALENGEIDAVMAGMTMTPERNMRVAFAGPYLVSGKAILSKSETLANAANMGALDNQAVKIAVLEGSTSQQILEKSAPGVTSVAAVDYDTAIKMVVDGEVDALFADYPICALAVLRNPDAGLAGVRAALSFEPIGVALPDNDPLFVNLIQNYLTVLEGSGLLELLRARWLEDGSWLADLP